MCPRPRLAEWLTEPMRRNRATYWKVALAAVFINIFGLLTALFTMTVYDRVVPNNATLVAGRAHASGSPSSSSSISS